MGHAGAGHGEQNVGWHACVDVASEGYQVLCKEQWRGSLSRGHSFHKWQRLRCRPCRAVLGAWQPSAPTYQAGSVPALHCMPRCTLTPPPRQRAGQPPGASGRWLARRCLRGTAAGGRSQTQQNLLAINQFIKTTLYPPTLQVSPPPPAAAAAAMSAPSPHTPLVQPLVLSTTGCAPAASQRLTCHCVDDVCYGAAPRQVVDRLGEALVQQGMQVDGLACV